VLKIEALSSRVFRVRFSKTGQFPPQRVPTIVCHDPAPPFRFVDDGRTVWLTTFDLVVAVDRTTGSLTFKTRDGKVFLAEQPGSRALAAGSEQAFLLDKGEAIYGLGQHQDGLLDHRGSVVTLEQQNREVAIPFAVSSRGYGLLWNNPAGTKVSVDVREAPFAGDELMGDDGKQGGSPVTTSRVGSLKRRS